MSLESSNLAQLVDQQIAYIIDQESVRLPPEELKATGPGLQSAFVAAIGRRTGSDEGLFTDLLFRERGMVQHFQMMTDLLMEGMSFIGSRVRFIH